MAFEAENRIDSVLSTLSVVHHLGEGWSMFGTIPIGHMTVYPKEDDPRQAAGIADLMIGARYDFSALYGRGRYIPGLALRLAVGLPSGSQTTFQGAFSGSITNEIISIGLGAMTLFPALDIWLPLSSSMTLVMPVSARIPLQRSPNTILFPTTLSFGLGLSIQAVDWLNVTARVAGNVRGQAHELGLGVLVNSGGTTLAGELDLGFQVHDRVRIVASGRVPFYHYARGQQIVESFSASIAFHLTFDGNASDDDDADDDDGQTGSETTLPPGPDGTADSKDIARGGKTFELRNAFVVGKVSVLDFWAEWCKSCKVLTKKLEALAARHGNLAIRKAEVPTFDTPIAKQYLPGVKAMPNVWIYDPKGRLIHKLSGTAPDEVLSLVKAALKRFSSP